jgi:hypothetical protein
MRERVEFPVRLDLPPAMREPVRLEHQERDDDQPDHDLENRSAAGSSPGAMRRIRFGTGSGRETQHSYLAEFYKKVDHGIHELLNTHGSPLLLAGVDEDTALYRAGNTYPMTQQQMTAFATPANIIDSATLSSAVIVGTRLNDWKMMPTLRRRWIPPMRLGSSRTFAN